MWFALGRRKRWGKEKVNSGCGRDDPAENRSKVLQMNAAVKGDWFCYCWRYIVATIWTE
jgi:hypothetical protein